MLAKYCWFLHKCVFAKKTSSGSQRSKKICQPIFKQLPTLHQHRTIRCDPWKLVMTRGGFGKVIYAQHWKFVLCPFCTTVMKSTLGYFLFYFLTSSSFIFIYPSCCKDGTYWIWPPFSFSVFYVPKNNHGKFNISPEF
jgi:hypothetical protein